MKRVGITGQSGFIGTYLYNTLGLNKDYERVQFMDSYFSEEKKLRDFVSNCDVIIHLAGLNRHPDPKYIYETNIALGIKLIEAMETEGVTPHVIFSSSIHEYRNDYFGKSKRDGRKLFEQWAIRSGASFSGLIIPNVFGPFSQPYYNTFIATFAHQIINGESPTILVDNNIKLIYIWSLCTFITDTIKNYAKPNIRKIEVPYDIEIKVSEILIMFEKYKTEYLDMGIIPIMKDRNEVNLFNTFRSFINFEKHFPVKSLKNMDNRGVFVDALKLRIGGQISFSTTRSGITRGNHFHTRKIERVVVIKGKARMQLRRISTKEIITLYMDGNEPSYVDVPVWYTHNISNIGEKDLYTRFWVNEFYDPYDSDTYFEQV